MQLKIDPSTAMKHSEGLCFMMVGFLTGRCSVGGESTGYMQQPKAKMLSQCQRRKASRSRSVFTVVVCRRGKKPSRPFHLTLRD